MQNEQILQAARQLTAQGQLDGALAIIRPLAQQQPPDTRVLNLMGSLLLQTGSLQDAIRMLEHAAKLTQGSGIPWINLGHALRKAKRFPEAVSAFQSGVKFSPLEPEGFVGLGEALLETSQFAKAHQAFSQALSIMPERATQRERATVGHFGTAPFWWQPYRYGPIELRPLRPDDVPFFAECCADRAFMDRFNAPQTPTIDRRELAFNIEQEALTAPAQRGNVKWVVWHVATNQPVGLAGLPSFQLLHRRAEVAGGVRGSAATGGMGIAAWLATLSFAFEKLGIHKTWALVYHTNPSALRQLLNLAFRQEGLLSDHLRLQNGTWLHLHYLALFQPDWASDTKLCALKKRFLHST